MAGKTPPVVTKGTDGEPVKLPHALNNDRFRGAAVKLIKFCQEENVDGTTVYFIFDVINTLTTLGYDGDSYVTQMIQKGYLVPRTVNPDEESYYVFTSYKKGAAFRT